MSLEQSKQKPNIEKILQSVFFMKAKSSIRFLDMLPAAVYVYNFKEKELYVNSFFERITSVHSFDLLDDFGLKKAIAHPDDWNMIKQCYNDSMQYHTDFLCEYRVVNDAGIVTWVRDHAEYVFDSKGETIMCQGVLSNINDHVYAKQIIEQRRQIEQTLGKFAKLFFHKENIYNVLDESLKEIGYVANASRVAIFEKSNADDFVCLFEWHTANNLRSLSGTSVLPENLPFLKSLLSRKELVSFSELSQIPDLGSKLRNSLENENVGAVLFAPIFNSNELIGCIRVDSEIPRTWDIPIQQLILIVSLIYEQSKVSEAINKLEQEKLAILDSVSECVLLIDQNSRIVWGNDKFFATIRLSQADAIGKESDVLWNGTIDIQYRLRVQECIETGKVIQFERKLDNDKWYSISLSPVKDDSNQSKRVVETSRDITNIRDYENQLIKAKDKAEESDRLKSAFILNLSHEIRTPMNAILGFTQLLAYHNISPEKKKQFYELVETNTNQLSNIITDVINLAKLETNQFKIKNETFLTSEILSPIIEIAQKKIQVHSHKKIDIVSQNFDQTIDLESDIEWVKKIIDSLFDNAIKFTDKGCIELGNYIDSEKGVVFYVKDTGIGIASENFEAIFLPYRQVDGSETRLYGGNGLGLTIAQRVLKLLGGSIWLTSELGKGSTFFFNIPSQVKQLNEHASTKLNVATPNLHGKKVLIVDDIEDVYQYLSALLEFTGAECMYAPSGIKAIEICNQNPDISLILMDVMMPEMDGIETVKRIREFRPNVTIFAQTAYAMAKQYEDSIIINFNEIINKPIRMEEFYSLINKYFND